MSERHGNLWERSGWLQRILMVTVAIISLKALFNPVTHRLSPDVGFEDSERPGKVEGFHYTKKSWWGFRTVTYDRIRFQRREGPEYYDPKSKKWHIVPPEAWGMREDRDDDYREPGDFYR